MGYWTSLARALLGRGHDDNPRPVRPRLGGPAASTYAGTGLRFTPPGAGYDHWRDVGDFRRNAVVAICVNWLSRQFLQAQLRLGRRRPDGTYEETRGPRGSEHPLVSLLARRPNPFLSARQLWAGVIADYLPYGQAFLLQARSLGGDGPPAELYWLPARRVEIRAGNDPDRPVDRYRYFNGLAWDDYPPDDVLHLRDNPDDDNPILGRGRGAEQVRSVAALNNGERYTGSVLRNAHAGKLLVPRDSSLSLDSLSGQDDDESRSAQRRRARLNLAGESAGSIDVALRPLDVLDLGLGPEQMALDRVLDRPEALVVAAFGLNCMALDLPASDRTRTYANKAEARREAWENGVIPLQDALLDDLNHTLVPQFDPSGRLELWWDRSDVPALREDATAKVARASALFQATLIDRDTARDLAGLEPLGDDDPNGGLYHGEEIVGDKCDGAPIEGREEDPAGKPPPNRRDVPGGEFDPRDSGRGNVAATVKARRHRGGRGGQRPNRDRGGEGSEEGRKKRRRGKPGGERAKTPGNCGTGAGGFQRGNTCAHGGVGRPSGMADVLDAETERALLDTIAQDLVKYIKRKQKKQIQGAVLSVLRDRVTGEIFDGQNLQGGVPDKIHPMLEERLIAYMAANGNRLVPKWGTPGSHSEFWALNKALLRREALGVGVHSLDDFAVYNVSLWNNRLGTQVPRCGNCRVLTDGIRVLSRDTLDETRPRG